MKWKDFFERHGWKLIALVLIALVVFLSMRVGHATGTSTTVSWVHPVFYTDGSALAVSAIKETVITWRRPGSAVVVGTVRISAPATSAAITGLTCGNFNFTAATVIAGDVQSEDAGPVLYATGIQCPPNAPSGFKVE